jgi:hypothetical protein
MLASGRQWTSCLHLGRVLVTVASWWLAGCSGAHEPTQTVGTAPHAVVAPTANIPALLGHSIDELRSRLGASYTLPAGYRDLLSDGKASADSLLAFRTGGLQLVAAYDVRTRQVRDLLILGQQEDTLMGRASLQSSARGYLVLPVFRPDNPNRLLGLRVLATNQQ